MTSSRVRSSLGVGGQILGSSSVLFVGPIDCYGLELGPWWSACCEASYRDAERRRSPSSSALWQDTLILLLCCSPVPGNFNRFCHLSASTGKEWGKRSPAGFIGCGALFVLGEMCSVSRTVSIALKFLFLFDTVGSHKVIWLHQRQNPYLCLQLNPAQPQSWWWRW